MCRPLLFADGRQRRRRHTSSYAGGLFDLRTRCDVDADARGQYCLLRRNSYVVDDTVSCICAALCARK
jgi:hypothetical protein